MSDAMGPTGLRHLQRMARGEVPPPPVARLIGLELIEVEDGHAVFRLRAEERHTNPMGTIHGGVLCDLADAAMGCAFATTIRAGESYTTLELAINFLKPVWTGTLTATGRMVKRTRRTGLTECDIVDEKGSLVARAKCSCLVLDAEDAKGR
jgi:uncharacterized protein (TIGR00369 family)